jgi:hypothetical protein
MLMTEVLSHSLETFFGQEYKFLISHFFALNSEYINYVYEVLFVLMQHGNWNFRDAYCLPVALRTWFYEKLVEFLKPKEKQ